jgi:putative salt-induced outer membrane protein YdiY
MIRIGCRGSTPFRTILVGLTGLLIGLLASLAVAQDSDGGWTPPSPTEMPTKFDWVQLPSGEWLAGEVVALYDGTFEFDSEEMGLTRIDWDDVVELRTVQVLEVRPDGGASATGKVVVKDGKVTVVGDQTTVFEQGEILAVTAGVPRERNFWSGEASGSANYQSGNTDTQTLNARVLVQRRTVEQRIIGEYIGNYDETENEETENNHRVTGDWDRFVTDRIFWSPVVAEYFKDKFQNIKHRVTLGPAIGYQIIDTAKTSWRVSGGPAYTKTWFNDVPDNEDDGAGSFGFVGKTRFDHELTDDIDVWYDYRFLWAEQDAGGYSHRMEAGIAYDIIGDLDLRASYIWDYIRDPAEDENEDKPDKSDYQLLLGVGYSF